MKKKLLALSLCLLLPNVAGAEVFYACPSGTGMADGSSFANCCNGIADTDCVPSPLDTVYLCGAFGATTINTIGTDDSNRITYDGSCPGGPAGSFTGTLTCGSSADWLTFRDIAQTSASGACVFINGSDGIKFEFADIDTCAAACVNLSATADADDLAIDQSAISNCAAGGLTLIDTTAAGVSWDRVSITNTTWDSCDTVTDATDRGCIRMTIGAAAPDTTTIVDLLLDHNDFYDCDGAEGIACIDVGWQTVASGGARRAAVVDPVITYNRTMGTDNYSGMILKHASNQTTHHNNFSNNTGNGGGMVQFYSTNGTISLNTCSNNTPGTIDGGGIDMDHGNYGIIIEKNTCTDNNGNAEINSGYGIMILDSEALTVRHNYLPGNKYAFYLGENAGLTTTNSIYNNTGPNSDLDAVYIASTMTDSLYNFQNNILIGSGRYGMNNIGNTAQTADYNLTYGNVSGDYFQQAAGAHDLTVDPLLDSTGRPRLKSLYDAGAATDTTYCGQGNPIGAWELCKGVSMPPSLWFLGTPDSYSLGGGRVHIELVTFGGESVTFGGEAVTW